MTTSGKARTVPKKSECPLATSSGPSADSPTDLATTSAAKPKLPLFPELPPPHADGWQPQHLEDVRLNMPMLQDPAEMWAMWIDQNPDHCPRGIVVMPDGRVSMCGIRGMQLIKRRNPQREAVEQHRTQYLFLAAQLFASPSTYWHALQQLHLTVAPGRLWAPCACPIANLTIDDLMRFFAEQGYQRSRQTTCLSMRINGSPKPLLIDLPNRPRFNRSWIRSTSQSARLAISRHRDMVSSGGIHSLDGQPSCMWDNYRRMNVPPSLPSTGLSRNPSRTQPSSLSQEIITIGV
jgi:hypothetical protein